jgi:hypothetical protein
VRIVTRNGNSREQRLPRVLELPGDLRPDIRKGSKPSDRAPHVADRAGD